MTAMVERADESVPAAEMKVVGRRAPSRGGLAAAAPLLDLVLELRGDKPFLPRGVYRFNSFEESHEWSMKMMTRPSSRALRR